jgi:hypothetical protein
MRGSLATKRRGSGKPFDKTGINGPKPGRPKGVPNQINRDIKAVIQHMVDWVGQPDRLSAILEEVAANRPEVLVNFLAKVAPKDISVTNPDGSLTERVVMVVSTAPSVVAHEN